MKWLLKIFFVRQFVFANNKRETQTSIALNNKHFEFQFLTICTKKQSQFKQTLSFIHYLSYKN